MATIKNTRILLSDGVLNNTKGLSGMVLLDVANTESMSCNDANTAGIYQLYNPANAPSGVSGWCTVLCIPFGGSGGGGAPKYCRQLLFRISDNKIYARSCDNGNWDSWTTLH